jgi:dihydroorotase-like cyclic amidohydrolase
MPTREVDLKLVGGRVVTDGGVLQAGVAVDGGTIVAMARDDLLPPARRTIDVKGGHILPGSSTPRPPRLLRPLRG